MKYKMEVPQYFLKQIAVCGDSCPFGAACPAHLQGCADTPVVHLAVRRAGGMQTTWQFFVEL